VKSVHLSEAVFDGGQVDIRSIKSTRKMDGLRCKTPEMVRKEILAHLLAYNLLVPADSPAHCLGRSKENSQSDRAMALIGAPARRRESDRRITSVRWENWLARGSL
jgi:hypothetical protein